MSDESNPRVPPRRRSTRPDAERAQRLPGGFQVGDRVGRYEIEGLAGRGGMGTVYRAFDPSSNRHVALKVLRRDATDLDRVRFEREIAVQANIRHPNIMPIFDAGKVGASRFYAMELLKDPVDLLHLTECIHDPARGNERIRGVHTVRGVIRQVILPMCDAVHHANAEGVLHRDIKPINVMVDRRNLHAYLIDFGVSSLLTPHNPRMAHIDESFPVPLRGRGVHVTGTLLFMPPEQARGEAHRCGDVWGLGALLHFLIAGDAPFEDAVRPTISKAARLQNIQLLMDEARSAGRAAEVADYEQMIADIKSGRERTLEDLRRDVLRGRYRALPPALDRRLDAIIARAMARAPERRYRDARELKDALVDWVKAPRTEPQGLSPLAPPRRTVWRPALLGALGGVALGAAAVLFWPQSDGPTPEARSKAHVALATEGLRSGDLARARAEARAALRAHASPEALACWERLNTRDRAIQMLSEARRRLLDARAPDLHPRERDRLLGSVAAAAQALRAMAATDPLVVDQDAVDTLLRATTLARAVTLADVAEGTEVSVAPWSEADGVDWGGMRALQSGATLLPGRYVARFERSGRQVHHPFVVADEDVHVSCPVDPASLPLGWAYVPGGTVVAADGTPHAVPALLWQQHEVTLRAYEVFLASLPAPARAQRMPRMPGEAGTVGPAVWQLQEDGSFLTDLGSLRAPVEFVSPYDARAFAAFVGHRLPTAIEWAWAARGPFGPPRFRMSGGKVHGVGETPADRNAFGLFDMGGNVGEVTATLVSTPMETGWVVCGASYLRPSHTPRFERAVVTGWVPQPAMGIRLVREPPGK